MKKNLQTAMGDLMTYLATPDKVPPGLFLVVLNDASQDVHRLLEETESERAIVTEELDIVESQDLIDPPAAAARIVNIKRRDLNTLATPLSTAGEYGMYMADLMEADPYSAVLENGYIRLIPMPESSMEDGLVVKYIPKHIPLSRPTDEPSFPGELSELWVALGLERIRGRAGCELADQRSVQGFIAAARERAMTYLVPGDGGQLGASAPYYHPAR